MQEEMIAVKGKESELSNMNSQLSELNNYAVDIGLKITQFNDRVQGAIPRDSGAGSTTETSNSLLSGIQETINYLQSSLHNLDSEVSRLNDIG